MFIEIILTNSLNFFEFLFLVDNICNVKRNGRTAYKLRKYYVIGRSTDNIKYHDVKHMRKAKVEGFLHWMNQLNRK